MAVFRMHTYLFLDQSAQDFGIPLEPACRNSNHDSFSSHGIGHTTSCINCRALIVQHLVIHFDPKATLKNNTPRTKSLSAEP